MSLVTVHTFKVWKGTYGTAYLQVLYFYYPSY
jgi:hypothetical protein